MFTRNFPSIFTFQLNCIGVAICCWVVVSLLQGPLWAIEELPGTKSDWSGFERFDFEVAGKPLMVIRPHTLAASRPWVWHGEFFGHKPAPDIELLNQGFHIVYAAIPNMLGCPEAVQHWNQVYDYLTQNYGFSSKVGLVGLSRGGLYCYNWAIANPHKVACIYADAPVCDFRSWPGNFGVGPGSPNDWQLVLKLWKFDDDEAAKRYQGNPVDNLKPLAQAGVPLLHVFGDADEVVPWQENTGIVAHRYQELGGSIELIRKAGVKHHPHGLDDSKPIVDFLQRHCLSPVVEMHVDETSSTRNSVDAGIILHRLRSPFQSEVTELKVLLPDSLCTDISQGVDTKPEALKTQSANPTLSASVLLVLPVEQQHQSRWGNGIDEVKKLDIHNRFQLICVEPSFSQLPWYADHPTDTGIRQESYMLQNVLPMLRWLYPEARHDRDGRLLLGFSKSGHGAWTLFLRNPQVFGRAAAWDAPLDLSEVGKFGSREIFGDQDSFRKYEISQLLRQKTAELKQVGFGASSTSPRTNPVRPRLIHAGYSSFRSEHQKIEALLNELQIPHVYHDGPSREHHWSSGWLEQLVSDLAKQTE